MATSIRATFAETSEIESADAGAAEACAVSPLFPSDMLLTPLSRNPIHLPPSTLTTVMNRPIPRFTTQLMTESPHVSVIVVTFNNHVFTRMCLESVLANTRTPPYEVIVVDNASTDGTQEYLHDLAALHPQVRVLLNCTNRGFAAANNLGLSVSAGQVLVLLNNDTIIPRGWLAGLAQHLNDPAVGLVGATTNRIGNEAEIEAPYNTYGGFEEFAACRASLHARKHFEIRTATMFCLALRRKVYERVGPLDEQFGLGMFEDDDYSMRCREAELHVVCAEDVFVHHFGQASFGHLAASGKYGILFHANRARWEAKWERQWEPYDRRPREGYRQLVERVREIVGNAVPEQATVLVASRGDEALIAFGGRVMQHFPQDPGGAFSGHHPADSCEAIAHLHELIARGAEYFVIPETMAWWLTYYPGIHAELNDRHRLIWADENCRIFGLRNSAAVASIPSRRSASEDKRET